MGWILLACLGSARAADETWRVATWSGDWNAAENWLGGTVPNGWADTAVFETSWTTGISISATTQVGSIVFNPGANGYTFTATPGLALTLSGSGIVNDSGVTQVFVAGVDGAGGRGLINFTEFATAGSSTVYHVNGATASGGSGGNIEFRDDSNAGSGTFYLNGSAGGIGGAGSWDFRIGRARGTRISR